MEMLTEGGESRGRRRREFLLGGFALALLALAAMAPALRGGFIWDDHQMIPNNAMIKAPDGLYRFWFTTEAVDYWPLSYSTHWLEWRVFGNWGQGYRGVNLALHVLCAILVWRLALELGIPGAWFCGAVFAVHPIAVEAVAWVLQRKTVLSTVLYFFACLAYMRFDRTESRGWYWAGWTAFLLALLSKSAVVMLPPTLLVLVWFRHRRLRWREALVGAPFWFLSLGLGLVGIWFQRYRALADESVRSDPFRARLAAAGDTVLFYLSKALVPVDLCFAYPKWEIDPADPRAYGSAVAVVAFFILAWRWRRSGGAAPLAAGAYYFLNLFPVLGFVNIYFMRYSWVADHWQYLALPGIIALVVGGGLALLARLGTPGQIVGRAAAAGLIGALLMLARRHAASFASEESLWRATIERSPDSWLAYNNLGALLAQRPDGLEESTRLHERAAALAPDAHEAHHNLGNNLMRAGRTREAAREFRATIALKPSLAQARNNLGVALRSLGEHREAEAEFREAARLTPDFTQAWLNLALALLRRGENGEARTALEQVLRIEPTNGRALYALAWLEQGENQVSGAARRLSHALRAGAVDPVVFAALAWLKATSSHAEVRDPAGARQLAEEATIRSAHREPIALEAKGLALAASGDFVGAEEYIRSARDVYRALGDEGKAEKAEFRRQAAAARKPLVDERLP